MCREIPSSQVRPLPQSLQYNGRLTNYEACGNTCKIDTFVGIDFTDITGGFLNSETLLEGNNAIYLGLELLIEFDPSLIHSLYATITTPPKDITAQLGLATTSLNYPQLTTANNGRNAYFGEF